MEKIKPAPDHLVTGLKSHAKTHLKSLMHELDPEKGWEELSSVSSVEKGWVHRFIERHSSLSKLFVTSVSKINQAPSCNIWQPLI